MSGAGPFPRSRCALLALAATMGPAPAHAHLSSTGMGPIYDGMTHFVTSPEDLVPALALALLAGLRGAGHSRRVLVALPGAWLLGGLIGLTGPATTLGTALSPMWFLLLGGLVAADARLSPRVIVGLAIVVGLCQGYGNGSGMGRSGFAVVVLLGMVFAVFVLVALAAAFVVRLRAAWARVAVRVAGSWIAASGLLLFGWAARRG